MGEEDNHNPDENYRYDSEYDEYGQGDYDGAPPSPTSVELTSVEMLQRFLDHEEPSVIAGFASTEGTAFEEYETLVAAMAYDWRWAHTTDTDVLAKLKIKPQSSGTTLLLYRSPHFVSEKHGDRPRERFPSNALGENAVRLWLDKNSQPLVGPFTFRTKERYLSQQRPLLVVFAPIDFEKNAKLTAYVLNRMRKVAAADSGRRLSYAVGRIAAWKAHLADFGASTTDVAHDIRYGLVVRDRGTNRYYGAGDKAKFSADSLQRFIDDYLGGRLKPSLVRDTAEEPIDDGENIDGVVSHSGEEGIREMHVVALTSKNFDAVVHDATKDVLVEFYAPWCGHCKALQPKYAAAAEQLKETPSIVLAKFDATEQDAPKGFDVQGYPTLLFVPARQGATPIAFEGEHEASAIVEWVKGHALSLE